MITDTPMACHEIAKITEINMYIVCVLDVLFLQRAFEFALF